MSTYKQRVVFAVLQLTIGAVLLYLLLLVEQRIRTEWIRIVLDVCIGGSILGLFFSGSFPRRSPGNRSSEKL
jgi:hypothetical protein